MDEPLRLVTGSPEGETPAVAGSSSFEAFFHDEARTLFRRLCTVTGNSSEAEEIMQDAFLALWERWDRIAGMDDPTGYLYRTAMNVFRKRTRRAALAIRRTFASAPDPTPFSEIDAQLASAWRVVGAYRADTGEQVGFARGVSDGVGFAYLADVATMRSCGGCTPSAAR